MDFIHTNQSDVSISPSRKMTTSYLLFLFVLGPCLTQASPYISPHPNGPLGLKDGDAPLDYNKHYDEQQHDNQFWSENSKYAAALLRPAPSDELPIMPIKFPTSKGPLPTSSDLHSRKLRKLLGASAVDNRYQSEKEPLDNILRPNGTLVYKFKGGQPIGNMPEEFKNMKFTIPDRRRAIRIKSKKTRRKMKEFLWAYSYCPVLFKWKDLGPRMWPRWLREGSCYNGRPSCSFPAGMTCKPKDQTVLYMLYWHCKRKSHCKWIKFKVPMITECGCGC